MRQSSDLDNVFELDNTNCYIHADGTTNIATIGLSDLIVVSHEGSVLIAPKDRAQDIKLILEEIKKRKLIDIL